MTIPINSLALGSSRKSQWACPVKGLPSWSKFDNYWKTIWKWPYLSPIYISTISFSACLITHQTQWLFINLRGFSFGAFYACIFSAWYFWSLFLTWLFILINFYLYAESKDTLWDFSAYLWYFHLIICVGDSLIYKIFYYREICCNLVWNFYPALFCFQNTL